MIPLVGVPAPSFQGSLRAPAASSRESPAKAVGSVGRVGFVGSLDFGYPGVLMTLPP